MVTPALFCLWLWACIIPCNSASCFDVINLINKRKKINKIKGFSSSSKNQENHTILERNIQSSNHIASIRKFSKIHAWSLIGWQLVLQHQSLPRSIFKSILKRLIILTNTKRIIYIYIYCKGSNRPKAQRLRTLAQQAHDNKFVREWA